MSEIITSTGKTIPNNLMRNYFRNLVNQFFKILPMRESEEDSLDVYILSLQNELLGCKEFIPEIRENSQYLSLLAILQYLHDTPETPVKTVRREVFRAISICNKLTSIYANMEVTE